MLFSIPFSCVFSFNSYDSMLCVDFLLISMTTCMYQEEIRSPPSSMLTNQPNPNEAVMPVRGVDEIPKPPVVNRRESLHI